MECQSNDSLGDRCTAHAKTVYIYCKKRNNAHPELKPGMKYKDTMLLCVNHLGDCANEWWHYTFDPNWKIKKPKKIRTKSCKL